MLYLTSRLYSPIAFDIIEDPRLLNDLVTKVEPIDDLIWKVWMITEVFHTSPTESYVYGEGHQTAAISQNAVCYLQVELAPGQTTFTLASQSQNALESLQALLANLYEPVTPADLDAFLDQNQDTPIQLVELFDRETGTNLRQSFYNPINPRFLLAAYPPQRWEVTNLSFASQINEPLSVLGLQIKIQTKQAVFKLGKEEHFLSHAEIDQAHNLFTLADMAFGGLVMPVRA
jgi:hypothetical protein